ncbi:hypothetical protein K7G98_23395 [Saccharothrix sp. MB29]|nr:hypothetical protein [Saccharothrix sp. MB29]
MTAAVVAAGGLALTGPVPTSSAEPRRDAVQQRIDKLVGADRHPGAGAVRDRHGTATTRPGSATCGPAAGCR